MKIQRGLTMILMLVVLLTPGQRTSAYVNSWSGQSASFVDNAGVSDTPALRSQAQELVVSDMPAGLSSQEWQRMQVQMELAQYQVTWQMQGGTWAYRAPNLAQGLALAFGFDGLTASRYAEGQLAWQFGLRLAAYGGQRFPAAIPAQRLSAGRERVVYVWNERVSEWYRNTPQGVEHGLTLFAPPAVGPLQLDFALSGDLYAKADGQGGLRLRTADGAAVLRYDQLAVYDRNGKPLAAQLALVPGGLRISIDAVSAVYPLSVDPLLHSEAVQLRASTPKQNASLGRSVSASGDVIVVGAPDEANGTNPHVGAAYVFQRDESTPGAWGEVQILRASDAQAGDYFGQSVSVSGDVIVVGASGEDGGAGDPSDEAGAAYVFERDEIAGDNWGQVAMLNASDSQAYDYFGSSVATSGDRIVVGASGHNTGDGAVYLFERDADWGETKILYPTGVPAGGSVGGAVAISGDVIVAGAPIADGGGGGIVNTGAAYVFQRDQGGAGQWGLAGTLFASDAQQNDRFGGAVAVSGDVIVVGATGTNMTSSLGAAYVFQRQQGGANQWGQTAKLTASDAQGGDQFGGAVAVSGDVIVIGARGEDGGAGDPNSYAGAAYVYQRDWGGPDRWGQAQILHASDAYFNDWFGEAVAVSGDVIVAGVPGDDAVPGTVEGSGAAYVFQRSENDPWRQTRLAHASDGQAYEGFGGTVAVSGDVIVVGASYAQDPSDLLVGVGAAYIFQRDQGSAGGWGELPTILRPSNPTANDRFGWSVAVSGDVIAVGAIYQDSAGSDAGAVYVFQRDQGGANQWGQVEILHASDAAANDYFGYQVSVSGDVIVAGAVYKDGVGYNSGAAYVFQRGQGGSNHWGQVKILLAPDAAAGDNFGRSVAVSGDVIAVGAHFEDGGVGDPYAHAGAVHLFQRDEGGMNNWGQVKILHASDPQANAVFGVSVALARDVLVVGASSKNNYTGAAYVFQRDEGGPGAWGQVQMLGSDELREGSLFGASVAVSRDVIVVGAFDHSGPEDDWIQEAGAAFVFRRNEGGINIWNIVTSLRASDAQVSDAFGTSVAVSGDVIVAGAPNEDGGTGDPKLNVGAAYIFQPTPLTRIYLPVVKK